MGARNSCRRCPANLCHPEKTYTLPRSPFGPPSAPKGARPRGGGWERRNRSTSRCRGCVWGGNRLTSKAFGLMKYVLVHLRLRDPVRHGFRHLLGARLGRNISLRRPGPLGLRIQAQPAAQTPEHPARAGRSRRQLTPSRGSPAPAPTTPSAREEGRKSDTLPSTASSRLPAPGPSAPSPGLRNFRPDAPPPACFAR